MTVGRRAPRPDPAVAPVEALLDAATVRHAGVPEDDEPQGFPQRALSICACVTTDDAPWWLITETHEGAIAWRRLRHGNDRDGLVQAELVAAGMPTLPRSFVGYEARLTHLGEVEVRGGVTTQL